MRIFLACLVLCLASLSQANERQHIEQLSSQLATLWQSFRPVCVLSLKPNLQNKVNERLAYLDQQLIGRNLALHLAQQPESVPAKIWQHKGWKQQAKLEEEGLAENNREALREYYFKLQVQTPNKKRSGLIEQLIKMPQGLNLALREGLWKTCASLGADQASLERLEIALDGRWSEQKDKIGAQLTQDLSAFLFYGFRRVPNQQLQAWVNLQKKVDPWKNNMQSAVLQYFFLVRQSLLTRPLEGMTNPEVNEPFQPAHPWPQVPSQSLLQP